MKKYLFILVTFIMFGLQSYATTWVQVDDYDYIDKDSIEYYTNDFGEIKFDKKKYWMKHINHDDIYKDIEELLEKKISYCIEQLIIDTSKRAITSKSVTYYDEKGNVIASSSYRDYKLNWIPVVPESKGEIWYELVKNPRYLKRMYKSQLLEQK